MKKIKMFFSSTIHRMQEEKDAIDGLVQTMNDLLGGSHVHFSLVVSDAAEISSNPVNDKANVSDLMKDCSFGVFLIPDQEDVSLKNDIETFTDLLRQNLHPKNVVFLARRKKVPSDDSTTRSNEWLKEKVPFVIEEYSTMDKLKFRLFLEMSKIEPSWDVQVKDGVCLLNNKEIIPIKKMNGYKNHARLGFLRDTYDTLKKEFSSLGDSFEERVKAHIISSQINETESELLSVERAWLASFRIIQRNVDLALRSPLFDQAAILIEQGDLEGANVTLSKEAVFEQAKGSRKKGSDTKKLMAFEIDMMLLAASIRLQTDRPSRFKEAEEFFVQAISDQEKYKTVTIGYVEYLDYLVSTRQTKTAIEIAIKLLDALESLNQTDENKRWAIKTACLLGELQNPSQNYKQVEERLNKACSMMNGLIKESSPYGLMQAAGCLLAWSKTQKAMNMMTSAEQSINKTIDILKAASKEGFGEHEGLLSIVLAQASRLSQESNRFVEAEETLRESWKIRMKLARSSPRKHEAEVALLHEQFIGLYQSMGDSLQTEHHYREFLSILMRRAKSNPANYEMQLANHYIEFGNLMTKENHMGEAEEAYMHAIEILSRLARVDASKYEPNLAELHLKLAEMYFGIGMLEKAEKSYRFGLDMLETLSKRNAGQGDFGISKVQLDLGMLYVQLAKLENAQDSFQSAISLLEKAAKQSVPTALLQMGQANKALADLSTNRQKLKEADVYLKKSLECYRKLAATDPKQYQVYFKSSMEDISKFYLVRKKPKLAILGYLELIESYQTL